MEERGASAGLISNVLLETDDPIQEALERARYGDQEAFAQLVRLTQDRIYSTLIRLVNSPDEAEDLAQEVYLRAYRSLKHFRGEARFETWLTRIAINLGRDALRRRRSFFSRIFSLDEGFANAEDSAPAPREVADESLSPERDYDRQELASAVKEGLAALPEEKRTLLVLRDIEGMSYEEIGEVLDLPVGTVKSRLSRARTELRRIIGPQVTGW